MNPEVLLIRKLMSRQNLSRAESAELMETLLRQDAQGWKLLAYSVASQTKGETVEELLGMHDAMHALTGDYALDLDGRRPMEVSSAGGSGVRKINVSTMTALVAGCPEVPIIKHSFWRVTSITGSADALAAVGIFAPSVDLEQVQKAVDEVGVAFYSAVFISPELAHLVHFGQRLAEHQVGVSTPFHLLFPVFAPIPIQYRMFGLNNPTQFEQMTELFRGIGFRNGLILRGFEGLDEASITSPTRVRGYRAGEDLDFILLPEEAGLKRAALETVLPVDAESNYRDFLRIVHGVETGPKRDAVALNAGLALWISEQARTIEEGVRMALDRLAGGEVAEKLTRVVELTGSPDVLRQAREKYLSPP
jgi:anthranilate phosphoribosyltransferase